eukprot:5409681-Pleurochrysis_carterae.AAC.1
MHHSTHRIAITVLSSPPGQQGSARARERSIAAGADAIAVGCAARGVRTPVLTEVLMMQCRTCSRADVSRRGSSGAARDTLVRTECATRWERLDVDALHASNQQDVASVMMWTPRAMIVSGDDYGRGESGNDAKDVAENRRPA